MHRKKLDHHKILSQLKADITTKSREMRPVFLVNIKFYANNHLLSNSDKFMTHYSRRCLDLTPVLTQDTKVQ